ncbi:MAG: GntR family transcriptional regulator, partial [Liquorilactobacillus ghanensis]
FPDNPGKTTLELCVSDIKLAKIMEVNIGVPFFYMETEISDQNKIPIHVGHQYYLGEYYKFDI